MKKYLPALASKVHVWNLFIGLVIGSAVATIFVSALAPGKDEVLRLCRMDQQSQKEDEDKRHEWLIYSMNAITDQEAYIRQLIAHHELEISMSKKMLELNPSSEVRSIANDIVARETKEIATLRALSGRK